MQRGERACLHDVVVVDHDGADGPGVRLGDVDVDADVECGAGTVRAAPAMMTTMIGCWYTARMLVVEDADVEVDW